MDQSQMGGNRDGQAGQVLFADSCRTRSLLNLKHFMRDLLNPLGNGPAVFRFERDGFQNQQVESSLHKIAWFSHIMIIYISYCR